MKSIKELEIIKNRVSQEMAIRSKKRPQNIKEDKKNQ